MKGFLIVLLNMNEDIKRDKFNLLFTVETSSMQPTFRVPSLISGGEVTVLLLSIHVVIVQRISKNYCCFNYPIFVCDSGDCG